MGSDDLDDPESVRLGLDGDLVMPDRSRYVADYGDAAGETIVLPDGIFERQADSAADLAGRRWTYQGWDLSSPAMEPDADEHLEARVGDESAFAFGWVTKTVAAFEPTDLRRVIGRLRSPERVGTTPAASEPPTSR